MEREVVSRERLLALLNDELHKEGRYEKCRFTGVILRPEADKQGCNWSIAQLRCSGMPAEACSSYADQIVYEAKKKYNIEQ